MDGGPPQRFSLGGRSGISVQVEKAGLFHQAGASIKWRQNPYPQIEEIEKF